MGFKCGIVGLPNVGKSTLFNALTQTAAAQAANYPFCTIEPNTGDVAVPDPRLETLAKIANSKEIIPTRLTFVDIAGLVRGASKGEGLGNQFLANIRECDAIAHVVRCFEDSDITHVEGKIAPLDDIETIETELMLADLESLEKRAAGWKRKPKEATRRPRRLLGSRGAVSRCCAKENRRGLPRSRRKSKAFQKSRAFVGEAGALCGNVEEAAAGRGNRFSKAVEARAGRGKCGRRDCLGQNRERDRGFGRRRTEGVSRSGGPRGAWAQSRHSRGLWAFAADHFFHGRGQRRHARGPSRKEPRRRRRRG